MAAQASKSKFKAKALEYFRQVETSGEPIIVTDHGQPKLEIRRYQPVALDPLECLDRGHREQVCEDIANSFACYRARALRSMVSIF
jgi:antitoxin (DNA-binding transcriptional repressor) of toxin-antitoxin stability system